MPVSAGSSFWCVFQMSFEGLGADGDIVWHVFPLFTRKSASLFPSSHISHSPEQLYIGEACWAFIFGIIIGSSPLLSPHPSFLQPASKLTRSIKSRSLRTRRIQPPRVGQRINGSDQHDHPRIHPRRTRHRRIRYRSRASKSLHGTTLEIIALPPRPCHDLGSSPLP